MHAFDETAPARTEDGDPRAGGADAGAGHHHHGPPSKWRFMLHYLEMVVAMFVGMFVFGMATDALLSLAGVELSTSGEPELAAIKMAFDMSVGMVAWMKIRRHGWPVSLEMAGAMFAPFVILFPLMWTGVISGASLHMWEHILMFPFMFGVMLRRRGEYGG